ncbi:MAG: phosphoenolpyruvate--protein phosphotransferase [Pseudomonadota bacterium]|nr:phosphoenolpyruvate--protein phosphotransferase [Pseudomonadota bacterium]
MPGRKGNAGQTVRLTGLGVAPGIAIGPAHVVESGVERVAEYRVAASRVPEEQARFEAALAEALLQLDRLKARTVRMGGAAGEELGYMLDAHAQMLSGSRLVRGVLQRITVDNLNAEGAVQREIEDVARQFLAMSDPYFAARADDVRDVGRRLILNLAGRKPVRFATAPVGAIVLAHEITPADTAAMDPRRIAAFSAEIGGSDSHTAIMARSLGLPAVLGVPELVREVQPGETVIVDGHAGEIIIRPDEATLARYRKVRAADMRRRRALDRLRDLPSETRDGVAIGLQANVEMLAEAEQARDAGAGGIGLLRSEFLFLAADDWPDEETQYQALSRIVDAMQGRPTTIRTLDIGFDKLPRGLAGDFTAGDNPALGLRAIRLGLQRPKLLETQLAAILRAGAHGPVRILIPMVTTVSEIEAVRAALTRVARRLKRRGLPVPDPLPPLGAMIEVPGAALAADSLARASDFISIGTNDLTMYTLALDRTNEQVASLYDPLHPGVLRLMQFSVAAAHRAGIPVNVCGEIAGDPRYAPLLVGLGIRDLSMAVGSLPRVKQYIRRLDSSEAARTADEIMAQADPARAAELLDRLVEGG